MEDLDLPRVVEGAADRILDDLEWLGVEWDEGPRRGGPCSPYEQSARNRAYSAAISRLEKKGLVYPCTCSRAEIARASSAPHAGEEGPRYPGTCREEKNRKCDRPAALRLRVPSGARVVFDDVFAGRVEEDVDAAVGDFVLRRADGIASYQLAVIVDDVGMKIEEVLRGADLLSSTARQILIAQLLDEKPPTYAHVPLVVGPDGERLAKRHQGAWIGSTVAELRAMRVTREELLGEIAAALDLDEKNRPIAMDELIAKTREKPMHPRGEWRAADRWVRRRA